MADFVHFRSFDTSLSTTTFQTLVSGCASDGTNNLNNWFNRNVTVGQGTIYTVSVPGSGNNTTWQLQNGTTGGTLIGSAITLTGNAVTQSVRGTLGASITQAAGASSSSAYHSRTIQGTPAINTNNGFSYTVAFPDADVSLLCAGNDSFNWVGAASNRFYSFGWARVAATATESSSQIIVPHAGTLQYLVIRYITSASTDWSVGIRVNGVTSALSIACPASTGGALVTDFVTQVTLVAGDLINIILSRTAGTGTSFQCCVMVGYKNTV